MFEKAFERYSTVGRGGSDKFGSLVDIVEHHSAY